MNGFVPALVAVLLAEFGPRARVLLAARHSQLLAVFVTLLIILAAGGGGIVASQLSGWADTLMIGGALVLAGSGQFQRVRPVSGRLRLLATFGGGGSLLIVFAMAARFGPLAAATGGLAGMVLALTLTNVVPDTRATRVLRLAAGTVLVIAGAIAAAVGLRLV